MTDHLPSNGLEAILIKYKKNFRIPENLNHYSEEDFKIAEKKFVKICINYGYHWCNIHGV